MTRKRILVILTAILAFLAAAAPLKMSFFKDVSVGAGIVVDVGSADGM